MTKIKKGVLISAGIILILVVSIVLFISPITKYLVEKYDEKYSGRQITLGWVYLNPFTGYIHFNDLKIHELNSDSIFFSADGITINVEMLKLPFKKYEISDFTLDHPVGIVIQNKKYFNFNDLIKKFSSNKEPVAAGKPVHFNLLGIRIIEGEFHYHDEQIPVNYFIRKVNIESMGKYWNADTIAAQFSFSSGTGTGDMKGDFAFNLKSQEYRTAVVIHHFDLNIIEQYLRDLTNYGSFKADVDAEMAVSGNFNDQEDVTVKGLLAINDFHFGKNIHDDYAAFDKLAVGILELNPKNHLYLFDTVSLSHPYFKYERYDSLDNIQTMFGISGSNITATKADNTKFNLVIEIADYIKVLSKNFLRSDYRINRIVVNKGDIKFNDYSLGEKFSLELNPLSVFADSVDKNHQRVDISFNSGIKPFGNLSVGLSINPKDSSDFDLKYHLRKMPLSVFNPYLIAFTSYPLDRGSIELNGTWIVRNGRIRSDNHLLVIDPRITGRVKNKASNWLPLWLAMAFVRDRGNVIDYEIPITGNLKDPKFHLQDVIFDILTNIFVKPATTSYRMEVKAAETEIEKSLALKWEMRHNKLTPKQEKFVDRMADFLVKNPDALITIQPQQYSIKEKEYILFFEAKKKYFLSTAKQSAETFSEADSAQVDKMSAKDSLFVSYLNNQVNDSLLFTVQDKCDRLIAPETINEKLSELGRQRENAFLLRFKEKGVRDRVRISGLENVIPYNGFSFYKIEYKGEFPESLLDAYRKMNELDNETPRKKFKTDRKKGGGRLGKS